MTGPPDQVSLLCRGSERPQRFHAWVPFAARHHVVHRDEATGEETWMAFFPGTGTLALSSRGPGRGSR